MKIFLDDCRQEPSGWTRTFHVDETIVLIDKCRMNGVEVEVLSLDNDLGPNEAEGRKVLDWLEEQKHWNSDFPLPKKIAVHSANSVARQRMKTVIDRLYAS